MSDLISRSTLEESLTHCKELGRKTFEAVLNVIKEQPAIEAVSVVHGEVVTHTDRYHVMHQRCSVCGNELEWKKYPNYCDNCGAKLKALEYDREQYEKGYGDAVKACLSVIREVYHNFCGYDLEHMTKYGNETAEQQHDSYSSLMMYEIAGEFDDLIDQIEGGYRVVPRDEAAKLINKLNDKVEKRIEEMRGKEQI
jgi:hypothetical protein